MALIVSVVYLAWRALFTIDMAAWFVAVPMLILEIHHALGLGIYTFSLWDVSHPLLPPRVIGTDLRVAILIPTYDESAEVLLPVISTAVGIKPSHETWVLDDGRRPQIQALAERLGARYLTRPDNSHAKAGNLNHALQHVAADVIAVVDADHVVMPGFLTNTLGYFEDPEIAVVQTPQAFYNDDSFEHEDRGAELGIFNEQSVFYRVILPAKNRWNAVFWCGTGALVRTQALRDVGGVATESITEDIHTSIRMHKAGWRLVAHNEVLARGLAASDAESYMLQRERWARGAMQVMRSERLLTSPQLAPAQKLAYAATLWGWFDSLRTLLFVLLPVAVLFTGALPIRAHLVIFGPAFLATFLMQFAALRLLARGHYPPVLSLTFEMLRMPAVVPALMEIVSNRKGRRFKVTPKGGTGRRRRRSKAPPLLTGLIAVSLSASVWAAMTVAGLTPLTYGHPGAVRGTMLFLGINVLFILVAVRRVVDARFAGERRGSVRFEVDLAAEFGQTPGRLVDLSMGGGLLVISASDPGFAVPRAPSLLRIMEVGIEIKAIPVQIRKHRPGGVSIGLQFVQGQEEAVADIARLLFHRVPAAAIGVDSRPAELRVAS